MNKIDFILSDLLNTLLVAEAIIKGHPSVNSMECFLLFKHFHKGQGKQKNKKVPSNPNKIINPFKDIDKGKKVNDPKSYVKCFYYVVVGHWKRNCPNYLTQKKDSGIIKSLIVKVSFIGDTSNSCCLHSGATNHICNTLQDFEKPRN